MLLQALLLSGMSSSAQGILVPGISDLAMMHPACCTKQNLRGAEQALSGPATRATQELGIKARDSGRAMHQSKADAERIAAEYQTTATVTMLCDTVIPPLCLLLILWLSMALPGSGKEKTS